jgi:hypothetical protein
VTTRRRRPERATRSCPARRRDRRRRVTGRGCRPDDLDVALVRYTSAGVPDPSFGAAAIVRTFGRSRTPCARSPRLRRTLVAAGRVAGRARRDRELALYRYLRRHLDPSFGRRPRRTTIGPATTSRSRRARSRRPHRRRRRAEASATSRRRYFADGALDPSFGRGGTVATDVAGGSDVAHASSSRPTARSWSPARRSSAAGRNAFALVRYLPTASSTRLRRRRHRRHGFGPFDEARALVQEPDGRLVVAGSTFTGEPSSSRWPAIAPTDRSTELRRRRSRHDAARRSAARSRASRRQVRRRRRGQRDGVERSRSRATQRRHARPGFGNGGTSRDRGRTRRAVVDPARRQSVVAGTTVFDDFAVARYDVARVRRCGDANRDGAISVTDGVLVCARPPVSRPTARRSSATSTTAAPCR